MEVSYTFSAPFQLVSALVNSNEGVLSKEVIEQIVEFAEEKPERIFFIEVASRDIFEKSQVFESSVTTSLCFVDATIDHLTIFHPCTNSMHKVFAVLNLCKFGFYKFEICLSSINVIAPSEDLPHPPVRILKSQLQQFHYWQTLVNSQSSNRETEKRNVMGSFVCTSATFQLVDSLDSLFDAFYWGWTGLWTESLESALLELLVAVDDDLVALVRSMKSMMGLMRNLEGCRDHTSLVSLIVSSLSRLSQ